MFDFIRKVFGRRNVSAGTKSAPSMLPPKQPVLKNSRQKETVTPPPPIPSGEFVVTLQEDGLLPERIAETISRLMSIDAAAAMELTQAVPVILLDGVAEAPAYKMQRELQMFGAVVDVSRDSRQVEGVVAETTVAPVPDPEPIQSGDESELERHVYQVFLSSLGSQPEQVVELLRTLLTDYETLPAVQRQVEMKIERVTPVFFGHSLKNAQSIAAKLNTLGATAVVYHENDPKKPEYDHDQYGLVLVAAGANHEQVISLVADVLALDEREAKRVVAELPLVLLENVLVNTAIAMGERFNALGARCDLPGPEKQVWLDSSTDHIQKKAGDKRVVLHRIGFNKLLVRQIIENLRPDLSSVEVEQVMAAVPQVLWTNIDLETAELVKLTLSDFGATVVIQPQDTALPASGIHAQNPDFTPGDYDVVLTEFDRMRRIFLIKKLRDLLLGSSLTELVNLLEMVPTVIVKRVDHETAVAIQASLAEVGGIVSITPHER